MYQLIHNPVHGIAANVHGIAANLHVFVSTITRRTISRSLALSRNRRHKGFIIYPPPHLLCHQLVWSLVQVHEHDSAKAAAYAISVECKSIIKNVFREIDIIIVTLAPNNRETHSLQKM